MLCSGRRNPWLRKGHWDGKGFRGLWVIFMTEFYYHLFLNYEINNEKMYNSLWVQGSLQVGIPRGVLRFFTWVVKAIAAKNWSETKHFVCGHCRIDKIWSFNLWDTNCFFFISRDRTLYNLFNTDWFFFCVGGIFPYISFSTTKDFTN